MNNKNYEIETLRAVAITMAVIAHFNGFLFPSGMSSMISLDRFFYFGVGVDLFFCISGYVVSKALIDLLDENKTEGRQWLVIRAFWVRRAYRLLPSAWFWMIFALICSTQFSKENFNTVQANINSIYSIVTFSGNIMQWVNGGLGPNIVYWSLALEEQFYFIFPFFLLLVARPQRYKFIALMTIILFIINREGGSSSIWWLTRVDGLAWGVLIYIFTQSSFYLKSRPIFLQNRYFSIFVTAVLIILLPAIPQFRPDGVNAMAVTYGLVALLCALLVLLASYDRGYIVARPHGIIKWLGSRSYAIYLAHIPAYRLTCEFWQIYDARHTPFPIGWHTAVILFSAISLVIVFSEISYRLIENPLRKRGMRVAKRILSRGSPS